MDEIKLMKTYAGEVVRCIGAYFPAKCGIETISIMEVPTGRTISVMVAVKFQGAATGIRIPVNNYHYQGVTPQQAAAEIAGFVTDYMKTTLHTSEHDDRIRDFECSRKNLYIRVYENNKVCPCKKIADGLFAACYVSFNSEMNVNVTEDILEQLWGKSFEEVFSEAEKNMEKNFTMEHIFTVLSGINVDLAEEDTGFPPLYVLESGNFGAGAVAVPGILKEAVQALPGSPDSCYILPSSIYEALLAPIGFGTPEELKEIVTAVNMDVVKPEDQLSDNVYLYQRGKITSL